MSSLCKQLGSQRSCWSSPPILANTVVRCLERDLSVVSARSKTIVVASDPQPGSAIARRLAVDAGKAQTSARQLGSITPLGEGSRPAFAALACERSAVGFGNSAPSGGSPPRGTRPGSSRRRALRPSPTQLTSLACPLRCWTATAPRCQRGLVQRLGGEKNHRHGSRTCGELRPWTADAAMSARMQRMWMAGTARLHAPLLRGDQPA